MTTYLNYIAELGAELVIKGKATTDNAIQKALELDKEKCETAISDCIDMKRGDGYENEHNKTQKGIKVIGKSTFNKFNR